MNANEELEMRRKLEIQMINKTLKPCPFCGGGAKYEKDTYKNEKGFIRTPIESYELVKCTECGAEIFEDDQDILYEYDSVVADKWNARV